ncbi:hypothetical protein LSH36_4g10029 [Paralvinella palmiformis]|uniref:Uncharacterized protein n=1 Tax=Paralvinella palmiformis TaxID=53620 RepID=A0AAD9KF41_9ANNE|nr:hypothetical protein LSH36_4g10029 [Paralvinella palmiformis]
MAATYIYGVVYILVTVVTYVRAVCINPTFLRGDWFSMERGADVNTLINDDKLTNKYFSGSCFDRWDDNSTLDANGNHDSKILYYSQTANCYKCYYMLFRTPNIVQYKQSECRTPVDSGTPPTLEDVCSAIAEFTEMWTFFRKEVRTVNCKNTFEGVFQFSYEWDVGGGGICDNENSLIVACQEPGSPYVDNEVFTMEFAKCPEVQSSVNKGIRFQCMGTWKDDQQNVWSGVADLGADVYRERFRCVLTRYDQEEGDNKLRYSMSWWADCSTLKSPYEGPVRLLLQPGRPFRLTQIELAYPDPDMYMFRQACSWNSFTIDREKFNWAYNTFILNPPAPIMCPIRGRFRFTQRGPSTELYRTRIRGITERPRHKIDCREYTSEIKSCDQNPMKILVDAEYCETVDHTGRPIGEYG